jgi:hypothetical protein
MINIQFALLFYRDYNYRRAISVKTIECKVIRLTVRNDRCTQTTLHYPAHRRLTRPMRDCFCQNLTGPAGWLNDLIVCSTAALARLPI